MVPFVEVGTEGARPGVTGDNEFELRRRHHIFKPRAVLWAMKSAWAPYSLQQFRRCKAREDPSE